MKSGRHHLKSSNQSGISYVTRRNRTSHRTRGGKHSLTSVILLPKIHNTNPTTRKRQKMPGNTRQMPGNARKCQANAKCQATPGKHQAMPGNARQTPNIRQRQANARKRQEILGKPKLKNSLKITSLKPSAVSRPWKSSKDTELLTQKGIRSWCVWLCGGPFCYRAEYEKICNASVESWNRGIRRLDTAMSQCYIPDVVGYTVVM